MKFIFFISMIISSHAAFGTGDFFSDGWTVEDIQASPSLATQADGTKIPIPGKYDVVAQLSTWAMHGDMYRRQVKSQTVTAPVSGKPGIIDIQIESENDLMCGDHKPDFSMASVGPHSASVVVVLASGHYEVYINGLLQSTLTLDESGINLFPEANYLVNLKAVYAKEYADVFGKTESYGVDSAEVKLTLAEVGKSIRADYFIAKSTVTQSNGDVLTKMERKGSIIFGDSGRIAKDCQGNSTLELNASTGEKLIILATAGEKPRGYLELASELNVRPIEFSQIK